MRGHRWTGRIAIAAALASAGAAVVPAGAQSGGKGFLFREPVINLAIRGGYAHATAGGDLFADSRRFLTLDRGDFGSATLGVDLAFRVLPRLDVVVSGGYAQSNAPSESRDFEGTDDLPIEQTTRFRRIPVTASARLYLTPRGRSLGQFAWVPARVAPYVGAGGGLVWYNFRQSGDFVDYQTLDIFRDRFETSGRAALAQAMAGVDFSLSNHVGVTTEARYGYSRSKLNDVGVFENFDRIDLSGATATVGVFFRF